VPHARANVRRHFGGELNLHTSRRPRIDAKRIGEHIFANDLARRERLLFERDRHDAVDGKRADILVRGNVGQQIQRALGEFQTVWM
jgi:hypothetical protein